MSKLVRTWICGLLAVLLTLGPGCAALSGPQSLSRTELSAGATPGVSGSGHQKVGSKGEVAKWIFIGSLLALVVFVDVLILPATYHDPFPCCRAIVVSCN